MKTLLTVCALFFCINTGAVAESAQQLDLNVFGLSYHPNGTSNGKLNNENYGLGLRYNLDWRMPLGFKPFLEADILINSNRGKTTLLSGGLKNDAILRYGPLSLGGGVAIVNIGYENPKFDKTKYEWTPAVFLSTTYNNWLTLNVVPVPKQDKGILLFWITIKHVW